MSELSKAIQARFTGAQRPNDSWRSRRMSVQFGDVTPTPERVYRDHDRELMLIAEFKAFAWLSSDQREEPVQKELRAAVIEAVFGEFRPDIRNIRMAIHERDYNAALELLDALADRMSS